MSLKSHGSVNAYVGDCLALVPNIHRMTARAMQTQLTAAVNTQLRAAGVPTVTDGEDLTSDANAVFDFQNWKIEYGQPLMGAAALATLQLGVDSAYHEARHCEQWYRMAQGVAAGKLNLSVMNLIDSADANSIQASLYMPLNIVQAAMANTDYGEDTDRDVEAWWNSVYASRGGIRGKKLAHIQARYDAYRNLPEEVDAWHLGGLAGDEFAQRCPRYGCPTYEYWKRATKVSWKPRSSNLKKVDTALKQYCKTRNAAARGALVVAFNTWYGGKTGGTTIRARGQDNAVEQLKAFVDQYNDAGLAAGGVGGVGVGTDELARALAARRAH